MHNQHDADDAQLLEEAQNGSAEAFGILYERYALLIFRFFYARLDNRLDAEDLTEEVFLRAWRSIPNYREQGLPFSAFLFRVAHNALVDHYRGGSLNQVSIGEFPQLRDEGPDAGEKAESNFEHQELKQTLDLLRESYRTVLVLRFLSDLSPEETAKAMGRSVGAVRVLQHRALEALRKLITEKKT